MFINAPTHINPLDKIRFYEDAEELRSFFLKLIHDDKKKGINFINDYNLHYTSLFILREGLINLNLFKELNLRNKLSLIVTDAFLNNKDDSELIKNFYRNHKEDMHLTLKWMIETGCLTNRISDEFDIIFDKCSILLIKIFKDITILPIIADVIFKRYNEGYYIFDLVWAFFESRYPFSLTYIAKHLKSSNPKELKLALKLLGFIPEINSDSTLNIEKSYEIFKKWFDENYLFLHFTGESFQQCTCPLPYEIVLEAKYLYKNVSLESGQINESISEKESFLLDNFKKLDDESKISLSQYSFYLHEKNINQWYSWLETPISRQLELACIGGSYD